MLPEYLYLTSEQISALDESVDYDADTNTISWIPSEVRILAGEKYSVDIATTVKDIEALDKLKLKNGAVITNKISYKDKESEPVDVTYKKAELSITKTSEDETGDNVVYNGEKLTYTVTVTNTGDVDAKVSETVTDILPSGFVFESMTIGASLEDETGTTEDGTGATDGGTTVVAESKTTTLAAAGTGFLHADSEECQKEHAFSFAMETVEVKSVERQKLSWNIGCLAAGETVTITYVGTVNTDLFTTNDSATTLTNTAEITDGSATNEIGVDYPVDLDKEVTRIFVNDTEVTPDISAAYPSGTVFEYTITVTNDKDHPSTDRYLAITDYLPVGMIPVAEEGGNMVLQRTDRTTKETDTIEWADFESSWDREKYSFSTTLDGYPVSIQLSENGQTKLYIDGIKKMDPGQTITIVYKTQMNLTEEQIEAGKSYQFTNTAKIGNASDSVTVTGGVKVGSLKITKQFLNYMNQSDYVKASVDSGFADTDPRMDVTYVLTGKDEKGNQIVFEDGTTEITFQLRDFYLHSNGKVYVYEIDKLPIGTYTLKESNYQLDGYNVSSEMSVSYNGVDSWYGDTATITIGENKQTTIWNNNCCYPKLRVKLQKSVFEIARETTNEDGTTTWTTLPEKYLFATDDDPNTKTMVVYNITLTATGYGKFEVGDVVDTLPDGMKYIGMCTFPNYEKSRSSFKNSPGANVVKTLPGSSYGELNDCMSVAVKPEILNKYKGVYIKDTYDEAANQVKFRFAINTEAGVHYLNAGEVLTFLVLCEVDDSSVVTGQPLENTVEFDVKDTVILSENPTFKTVNTPYDANQNNGDTTMIKNGDGTNTVSSSVTIMPENTIVPGIEKTVAAYILSGKKLANEIVLEEDVNIPSNSVVKWEIKVHNDGTKAMKNYSVEDSVTPDFHLMTEEEAGQYEITAPYSYQIYQFDGTPVGDAYNISNTVWETVKDTSHNDYTFSFAEDTYTIPAGGYAVLTMYTNNFNISNKIYTNTATVTPTQDFIANQVKHGQLVKDSSGKYTGVTASDEVYALGDFASISWKTIEEKTDTTNNAKGNQSKNFIIVDRKSDYVTYTNNIKNVSQKVFNDFVMIDLMPMKNDTGVVNRSDKRGSEFSVFYAGGLEISVADKDGNITSIDSSQYTIQFSSETGFTEKDFAGARSNRWHDEWKTGDCSFRIIMNDDFVLNPQETLVVQYDGKIEDTAVPGAIAWNSFGYQYYSSADDSVQLRAEPPKVGVKIPTVPIIQKEVIDSYDQILERNAGIEFLFALSERSKDADGKTVDTKLCEFTLCQGGYRELADLVDTEGNPIELENGKEYVVTEITDQMPEEYELIGIGENGGTLSKDGYSFVYYDNKETNIVVRNKVEIYQPELPATGGIGTTGFKAAGVVLMLLAVLLYGYSMKNQRKKGTM